MKLSHLLIPTRKLKLYLFTCQQTDCTNPYPNELEVSRIKIGRGEIIDFKVVCEHSSTLNSIPTCENSFDNVHRKKLENFPYHKITSRTK